MRSRLSAAVVAALAAVSLHAQTPAPPPPQPTFRTEANYIRVDMYAMRDGRAVEDLRPEDIGILEDGAVQKLESFEYVRVRPAGAQTSRVEPGSIAESRAMAADPRARVFVIFLDTYHVQVDGSHNMRLPLVRFLDRVIGQDDLVAVMTPEMSASDLTLGRKTDVISRMMQDEWYWGRRARLTDRDPKEQRYEVCYPEGESDVAAEMIQRRREKLSMDALDDLLLHLQGLREERKAVLTVSEGWRLFTENPRLARALKAGARTRVPGGPEPIFVGPEGKPRHGADPRDGGVTRLECDADRAMLAGLDHSRRLIELTERANRANVSFYPIYPRGLAPLDAPIGPEKPPPISVDARQLAARHDSLRTLASNTDGLTVIDTNDIERGMRRIVEDLTSYYLLGYYSTNTKLDGRFRSITVRVKRPGVDVRARRGYRGRTAEDLLTTRAPDREGEEPTSMSKALASLAGVSSRSSLRLRTATWSSSGSEGTAAAFWVVGELDHRMRKDLAWTAGAVADISVVSAAGESVMTATRQVDAAEGTFALRVPEAGGLPPGEYAVRVRLRPHAGGGLPVSDVNRVIVPPEPSLLGEPILWRRGPTTGPRYAMTADPRFQRSERVRLELASRAAGEPTARMLDRAGNPLMVPVQLTERRDESGEFRWIVVEAALAPLAAGDYAIEVTLDSSTQVAGFKVIP